MGERKKARGKGREGETANRCHWLRMPPVALSDIGAGYFAHVCRNEPISLGRGLCVVRLTLRLQVTACCGIQKLCSTHEVDVISDLMQ